MNWCTGVFIVNTIRCARYMVVTVSGPLIHMRAPTQLARAEVAQVAIDIICFELHEQ